MPYTLVHYPTLPSAEFAGSTGHGDWADCLAQMDHNVGRLLDTVDRLGLRADTVVVFTSDNGADLSTQHKRGSAGPWSGSMFTPMEGSNRVPFIIRWPGNVPADRLTDAVVHQVDTFTTLLGMMGVDVPTDRPIDGVDQRDLLFGESDTSAREGFPIFFGEKLYGAKWRNFKLHFVWQVNATDPVLPMGLPVVFNLLTNPREDPDENLATTHVWVITAAARMIGDFQASLAAHPPIPAGTADPYQPEVTPATS